MLPRCRCTPARPPLTCIMTCVAALSMISTTMRCPDSFMDFLALMAACGEAVAASEAVSWPWRSMRSLRGVRATCPWQPVPPGRAAQPQQRHHRPAACCAALCPCPPARAAPLPRAHLALLLLLLHALRPHGRCLGRRAARHGLQLPHQPLERGARVLRLHHAHQRVHVLRGSAQQRGGPVRRGGQGGRGGEGQGQG